jgi:hypothetical protein
VREWKFWDWIAYATLGISALFVAIKVGVDSLPPSIPVPAFLSGSLFGFLPIILFLIGSVILILRALGMLGKPHLHERVTTPIQRPMAWPESALSEPPKVAGPRHFLEVTPAFLMNLYSGHTDIQARVLTEPYLGKWIRVSGVLENIKPPSHPVDVARWLGTNRMIVSLKSAIKEDDTKVGRGIFYFNEDWFDRIRVIPIGRRIDLAGQISDIDRTTISIENCELIS